MAELLRSHIRKRVSMSEDDLSTAVGFFEQRTIRKRQFLLREGDVCRELAFVTGGCLREYTVDQKGDEHIIQFATADWWISDLNSFLTGQKTTHAIDALQDSEVLLLGRDRREELFLSVPAMERFFRLLLEANHVAAQRRINESLSASAEERYLAFVRTYPHLMEEVPLHQVASYLGITPQSLSRIRKG